MSGGVWLDLTGPLARVTLSHAGKLNAMSRAMWRELRLVFAGIQQDPHIRCVLIRGEGAHFCAGGDISEYAAFRFETRSLRDFHEGDVWGGLSAMLNCDVPIVAQIEGNCMGAGIEIASCCDLRIAGASARFGAPIAKLGFPMAPREAALVVRAVGELTAREMLLAASVLDAAQMLQRGFLSSLVSGADSAQLASEAQACADRICTLAPAAARLNKQSLRALAQSKSASPAIDSVADGDFSAYQYADTHEHREGIAAFVERRPPQFQV